MNKIIMLFLDKEDKSSVLDSHIKYLSLISSQHPNTLILWQTFSEICYQASMRIKGVLEANKVRVRHDQLSNIRGLGHCVYYTGLGNCNVVPSLVIICVSTSKGDRRTDVRFYDELNDYWRSHCQNFAMPEIPAHDQDGEGARLTIDFSVRKISWEDVFSSDKEELEDKILAH